MAGIVLGWERAIASPGRIGFLRSGDGKREQPSCASGPLYDSEDGHALIVAPTGKGKSRCIAIPQLLSSCSASAIVLDIKGELARTTADFRERELGHRIVRLDPWKLTTKTPDRLNPLDAVAAPDACVADLAFQYAGMLATPRAVSREPYWNEKAQTIVAGLIAVVATRSGAEWDRSFKEVYRLLHVDDVVHSLAVLLDCAGASMPPFARGIIASLLATVELTRSGILSTAENLVRVFANDTVQQAVAATDFDLGMLARGEPVTIYLVIPPAKLETHLPLVRLWLSTLLGVITERTVRPRQPTLLLLDEAAQLGEMAQIRTIMTLARGYGTRAMLFVQSLAQLRECYPDARSLVENASTIITFGHSSRTMSAEMAELFGDVSADALYRLGKDELAVKRSGEDTQVLRKCDYLNDAPFKERAAPNPMFGQGSA